MKTSLLYFLLLTTSLLASNKNMFIIKNKDGVVIKDKKIVHNTEYDHLLEEQSEILQALKNNKLLAEQNQILRDLDKLQKQRNSLAQSAIKYNKENMLKRAKEHLGERYVWGGTKPNAFDCSGYTQYIYKKEGVSIPRTAYAQSKVGKEVSRYNLKKGDLLFFLTDKKRGIPITHVGMYIGNGNFIHAASSKLGIIISSLEKSRYSKLFVKATRIIQ